MRLVLMCFNCVTFMLVYDEGLCHVVIEYCVLNCVTFMWSVRGATEISCNKVSHFGEKINHIELKNSSHFMTVDILKLLE